MTMTTDDELRLTVTRVIPAPPARVFAAWLDPVMLTRFMMSGPDVSCTSAKTDPRIGGHYSLVMERGGKDIPHHGTYLEMVPHSRLAFTWESPHAAPGSTIAIDFAPEGDGTRVTLTQVKFTSESSRDGHLSGWTAILEALMRDMA